MAKRRGRAFCVREALCIVLLCACVCVIICMFAVFIIDCSKFIIIVLGYNYNRFDRKSISSRVDPTHNYMAKMNFVSLINDNKSTTFGLACWNTNFALRSYCCITKYHQTTHFIQHIKAESFRCHFKKVYWIGNDMNGESYQNLHAKEFMPSVSDLLVCMCVCISVIFTNCFDSIYLKNMHPLKYSFGWFTFPFIIVIFPFTCVFFSQLGILFHFFLSLLVFLFALIITMTFCIGDVYVLFRFHTRAH